MPDGVIGNIQEFDSCVTGSSPAPVTDGSCSLFGKVSGCESGEQGSIPAATHDGLSFNGQRILRYERRDECSNHSKPTMARSSIGKMYPAFNRRVVSSRLTGPTEG